MNRVMVIADPGANWRATPGEELWRGKLRFQHLIEMTAAAGADVFKPQFLRRTVYPDGSAEAELVAGYEWPAGWLPYLRQECERHGLELMVTVYEPEHVSLVDPHVKRWKVSSFEAQRVDLLQAMAATGKRLIISTGTATFRQVSRAVTDALGSGRSQWVTYLHCVSAYPALPEQMQLGALGLEGAIYSPRGHGLSDHTTGTTAAILAVALRATVIEKHIRTADVLTGPDAHFALPPDKFAAYVAAIREAELMLGDGIKGPQEGEASWAKWSAQTGKRGTQSRTPTS